MGHGICEPGSSDPEHGCYGCFRKHMAEGTCWAGLDTNQRLVNGVNPGLNGHAITSRWLRRKGVGAARTAN